MEEKSCNHCKHYRAYYVKRTYDFMKLDFGHCVHPKMKYRDRDTPACKHSMDKRKSKQI